MTIMLLFLLILLLPNKITALSSLLMNERRRVSELKTWDGETVLGKTIEVVDTSQNSHRVKVFISLNNNNEKEKSNEKSLSSLTEKSSDELCISLPHYVNELDMEKSLWPSALAGSILFQMPRVQNLIQNKNLLELGTGLGLCGLVAGANSTESNVARPKSNILTDFSKTAIEELQTTIQFNDNVLFPKTTRTKILDWRDTNNDDDDDQPSLLFDFIYACDIAYYFVMLRPIIDTTKTLLEPKDGSFLVVGPANRASQWDLYRSLRDGCYNQLTDVQEGPWQHPSRMLLYNLQMGNWETMTKKSKLPSASIPIAVLLYGNQLKQLCDLDYEATKEDEETIEISF